MGELQHEPFQFAFNGFLKVAFQGSRVTSDAGLILVSVRDPPALPGRHLEFDSSGIGMGKLPHVSRYASRKGSPHDELSQF